MSIIFQDPISPTGTQNGVNKVFTLPNAPNPGTSLMLVLNGMVQDQGVDYTLAGSTVTYAPGHPAPLSTDIQLASYRYFSGPITPGLMTVSDIIYNAFRIAGVLGNAQRSFQNTGSYYQDAFVILNAMLDEWLTQRLFVYRVIQSIQNVNAGQQSYQIGIGAPDWNVPRPERIEFADLIQLSVSNGGPPTYLPLSILNALDWFSIAVPSITGSTPQKLYYEPAYPYGIAHLWPVPQIANQIALGLWQQISQFATVNDTVAFPPGYLKAITYNLARELLTRPWGSITGQINPLALEEAERSKMWVKSANRPNMDLQMRCEGAAQGYNTKGRWDITTNQWRWQ